MIKIVNEKSKFVLIFIVMIFNSYIYGKIECPKNIDNRTFVTIYLKDKNVFKGNGCLVEKRKSDGIIDKIIFEDTIFNYGETDSIHLHFISGYPDSLGWKFKVINGEISALVYDVKPWLEYYNIYPALELKGEPASVTEGSVAKEFMITGQAYYRTIWAHASRLKRTLKNLEFKDTTYDYSDSLVEKLVTDKLTSILYTKPILSELKNLYVLAILDYNYSGTNTQAYINDLHNRLDALKSKNAYYVSLYEKLRKAFVVYNSNNTDMLHQLYIDNAKVFFKQGSEKIGHARVSFGGDSENWAPLGDTRKGSLQWRMQFSSSPYHKTVNIDQRSRIAMRYQGILVKLIFDGNTIIPEETDSIMVNGHIAYPENGQWKFK